MPDALTGIALHAARRLEKLKSLKPLDALRRLALYSRPRLDLAAALKGAGKPRIVAEVRFASPAEGFLRPRQEATAERAAELAWGFAQAGAAAVAVATDRNFLAGDYDFLVGARALSPATPLLMRDYVVDPYQLELARAHGADAVWLIAGLLRSGLAAMLTRAKDLELQAVVEIRGEEELELARRADAKMILSGERLQGPGIEALLAGAAIMKADDPVAALRALL